MQHHRYIKMKITEGTKYLGHMNQKK